MKLCGGSFDANKGRRHENLHETHSEQGDGDASIRDLDSHYQRRHPTAIKFIGQSQDIMKITYRKPTLIKAQVTLQAVTATPTSPVNGGSPA